MKRYLLRSVLSVLLAALMGSNAFAVLFVSEDNGFTVDLPATWVKVNPVDEEVLSLKRDAATMKISRVQNCRNIACITEAIQKDLDFVKTRKFKVLENTYSGDIIKTTEFSTGDPLLAINYSGATVDFTTAYFLSGGRAYAVAIKGIPYVEADLILSFISPAAKPTDANSGAAVPKVMGEPFVSDISADILPVEDVEIIFDEPAAVPAPVSAPAFKVELNPARIACLILLAYLIVVMLSFVARIVLPGKEMPAAANPRSSYPVKGSRLYGSPDLFFKLHDNQGNHFIATTGRWGSLLVGLGFVVAAIFFILKVSVDSMYVHGMLMLHAAIVNTIISVSSLLSVLGLIVAVTGFMINLLFGYKYHIYNSKGTLAFKCVQKGWNPLKEEYVIAAASDNAVIFRLARRKMHPLRKWTVYNNQGVIAEVQEASAIKAVFRMLLGHLCGFLRADYKIKGRVDSAGYLFSQSRVFTYFRGEIDKPEAIESDIMLITSAVIFMRDRDKAHPWVN